MSCETLLDKPHVNYPSAFRIGERVILDLGVEVLGRAFYVRAIIFTASKVRYSVFCTDIQSTLHNIDSCYVLEYKDESGQNEFIEMPEDNYS